MAEELEQNVEQNNDALIQQLEELTTVIDTQLELEQAQKEEQVLLEQEQQKQLKEEEQSLLEQQEQELLLQQQKEEETKEFQETVLQSISELNATNDPTALAEQQAEIIEQQALMLEYYEEVFPAVKQVSEWGIIFLGLIPLFMVVRWLGQMFDSAFR